MRGRLAGGVLEESDAGGSAFDCKALVVSQQPFWRRSKKKLSPPPERAAVPSPRTAWTSGQWVLSNWCKRHSRGVADAANYRETPAGSRGQLLLLGDSIFELLLNRTVERVLDRALGTAWPRPLVFAQGGDQTQHVLWRLQHGQLSRAMAADPRLTFVLHVGTNNLGYHMGPGPVHSPEETRAGVVAVASWLLRRSRGRVLLTSLLPRADEPRPWVTGPWLCPRGCNSTRSFVPAVATTNAGIRASADELGRAFAGRLGFADCAADFRVAEYSEDGVSPHRATAASCMACEEPRACRPRRAWANRCIGAGSTGRGPPPGSPASLSPARLELMVDYVHPNMAGMEVLMACIARHMLARGW